MLETMKSALKLDFNPFEPTATGKPLHTSLSRLGGTQDRIRRVLGHHAGSDGTKTIVVRGEYGAGKTCVLRWLHEDVFPGQRTKSFYFRDPGVHFYRLADSLLRFVGRKDFAKFIWELAHAYVDVPYHGNLFEKGFEEFILADTKSRNVARLTDALQKAILHTHVTSDEEIAHCFARIVTTTARKPYFEYRDFVPTSRSSIVPELEEPAFFDSILKTLSSGYGVSSVAFVIDEFEEISLQKRLSRKAAHDYLTTLKRLIDLTEPNSANSLQAWLVLSMTPPAYDTTITLEPALADRIAEIIDLNPLDSPAARELVAARLRAARSDNSSSDLFPFPDDLVDASADLLSERTYSTPRRLVKTCFLAIAAARKRTTLPFSQSYLHEVEAKLYGTPTQPQ